MCSSGKLSSVKLKYHTYPKLSMGTRDISAKALCITNTHQNLSHLVPFFIHILESVNIKRPSVPTITVVLSL